jgi:indole-3-glycerol phosphate synthase
MSILDKIAGYKRQELAAAKGKNPLHLLERHASELPPPRGFRRALQNRRARGEFGLIAEIKKASPSQGVIREDFDPVALARAYRDGGASCLSVLTDTLSFQGSLENLSDVRAAVALPVLRKDFMLDPYQVVEARAYGADCILVILAMVDDATAGELLAVTGLYELDALVEIHDEEELRRAMALGAEMIGINNRDLKSFKTDLSLTLRLAPKIPGEILVVAESGIASRADIERLAEAGVTTFLIGESLMRQSNVAAATRALVAARAAP